MPIKSTSQYKENIGSIVLAVFETRHFTFTCFLHLNIPSERKSRGADEVAALVVEEMIKQLPKHAEQYPGADIEGMARDIRKGDVSWGVMKAGHLYRDNVKL